ncbi:MAG: hypothetical protein SOV02_08915 [Streptococcus infantarius]|nr:hypothetical protein [Streptococcus infantarius]
MVSYQDFISEKDSLDFEVCSSYYQTLLDALQSHDEEGTEYWNEFISASVDYAKTRGEWLLLSREEKQAKDEARTVKHNKVIYTLKIFIAYSQQKGFAIDWFETIKDNRKQIGDLACYIAYVYAVNAR